MWLFKTQNVSDESLPSRRAVLLGVLAVPLAACGFEPALGPNGNMAALRNQIRLPEPQNRNQFNLVRELEIRIGRGQKYDLSFSIDTNMSDVGITPDQVITRRQINGTVSIELRDIASGTLLLEDRLTGFTSFATTDTTASTNFARNAAFERLMVIFADRIVSRLAVAGLAP